MSEEDLASHHSTLEEPITTQFCGHTIHQTLQTATALSLYCCVSEALPPLPSKVEDSSYPRSRNDA